MREFLVEIRFKDWVALNPGESRIVAYEEVVALDEGYARHVGFDQFAAKSKYSPIVRRKFESRGLPLTDYCAPDAVEI